MLSLLLFFPIFIADNSLAAGKSLDVFGRNFAKARVSSANFRIEKSVPNIR